MRSLFEYNSGQEPILAPLGSRRFLPSLSPRRLPPAAAPLAVTVVGGLALVVVLGWFLSHGASGKPTPAQQAFSDTPPPVAAQTQEVAQDVDPGSDPAAAPEETASITQAAPEPAARDAGMPVEEEMGSAEDRRLVPARPFDAATAGTGSDSAPPVHALMPVDEAASGQLADPEATTAAIPRSVPVTDSAAPDVAVAETEAEIEALEALQRLEMGPDLGAAGEPSNEETAAIAPQPATQMRAATTTEHVNLRAGPDGDTEVLTIVPGRAAIEAEADCGWCAVRYDGRTGYLYRSFIRYGD